MANTKRGIDAYRRTMQGATEDGRKEKDPPEVSSETKVEGLIRTSGENPYRKAAKFLLLIGKEEAGKILRHFTEQEVEAISREIAKIKRIEPAEAERLLAEVGFLKEARRFPSGGVETARRMLVDAFGEEKGRAILSRSVPPEQKKLFDFLGELEPNQAFALLREETPAVLSVIVPHLPAEKASRLFELFDADFRKDLVKRMAKKQKINLDVLVKVEEALREKMRRQAAPVSTVEVDGKSVLAEILKYVDLSKEEEILGRLGEEAPEVAEEIRDRLFSIDVLEGIEDRDLQKVLADIENREIALVLKGKTDRIRAKVLGCLSERRRSFVADEYRFIGPVPRKEVDAATKDFLGTLKRLEEEGKLVIRREADKMVD